MEIDKLIIDWHRGVGLMGKETTQEKRLCKLQSELGELCEAVLNKETNEAILEIGDMYVIMCAIAYKLGSDMNFCAQMAYEKISNRTGRYTNGTFIKD